MPVFETSYDTTACTGYRYTKIIEDLRKAKMMGGFNVIECKLNEYDPSIKINLIEGGNFSVDTIPFFKHPVFIASSAASDKEELTLDVREFGKFNPQQSQFMIRNGPEYTWALKRGILNYLWLNGNITTLRDISPIAVSVYIDLISECVSRRFALDPAEQMTVAILSGFFYNCLFTNKVMDEEDINRTVGSISRVTKIPAQKVYSVLEGVDMITDIEHLCTVIKEKVDNVALSNLNAGTLFAVCCGNWFGTNAREILAVGLEHIPTWIMIVSASLESATYKRSTLSKISARFDKNNAGVSFSRSLETLLGGPNAVNATYATFF